MITVERGTSSDVETGALAASMWYSCKVVNDGHGSARLGNPGQASVGFVERVGCGSWDVDHVGPLSARESPRTDQRCGLGQSRNGLGLNPVTPFFVK